MGRIDGARRRRRERRRRWPGRLAASPRSAARRLPPTRARCWRRSGAWRVSRRRRSAPVSLSGEEPALPSSFRIGAAAQATVAAVAAAAAAVHRRRGGPEQAARVDMRHAALEFHSEHYLRLDGAEPPDPWDSIAGTYRCGDGRRGAAAHQLPAPPRRRAAPAPLRGHAGGGARGARRLDRLRFRGRGRGGRPLRHRHAQLRRVGRAPAGRGHRGQLPPLRIERIGDAPPTPLPPAGVAAAWKGCGCWTSRG